MYMSQNLWQIVKYEDLIYNLKKSEKQFIVLSLILSTTKDKTKKMIKRYIKNKSQQYPQLTFLYYLVKDNDIGRNGLFHNDLSKYPKILHIYDIKELLIGVTYGQNDQQFLTDIEKSFEHMGKYYNKNNFNDDESNMRNDFNSDDDDNYNDDIDNAEQKDKSNDDAQINQQFINAQKMSMENQRLMIENSITEKKKFEKRLEMIQKKKDEYELLFWDEFKKRKIEEEKMNKTK